MIGFINLYSTLSPSSTSLAHLDDHGPTVYKRLAMWRRVSSKGSGTIMWPKAFCHLQAKGTKAGWWLVNASSPTLGILSVSRMWPDKRAPWYQGKHQTFSLDRRLQNISVTEIGTEWRVGWGGLWLWEEEDEWVAERAPSQRIAPCQGKLWGKKWTKQCGISAVHVLQNMSWEKKLADEF